MFENAEKKQGEVAPWSRVVIMILGLVAILIIAKVITGSFLPTNPPQALIFQNALLLIVLGSAVVEHKFTKPADSVVNSLMGMITLVSVYAIASPIIWWVVFIFCAVIFVMSTICVVVSSGKHIVGLKQ